MIKPEQDLSKRFIHITVKQKLGNIIITEKLNGKKKRIWNVEKTFRKWFSLWHWKGNAAELTGNTWEGTD